MTRIDDISSIDAKDFPYVKLKMTKCRTCTITLHTSCGTGCSPITPVPEGAIAPNIYFEAKDSVGVGDSHLILELHSRISAKLILIA